MMGFNNHITLTLLASIVIPVRLYITFIKPPCYNHTSLLGVKHQLTYLHQSGSLCITPFYGLQLWHAMCRDSEMLGYIPDLFRAARTLVLLSAPHNSMFHNTCILPPATHLPPKHTQTCIPFGWWLRQCCCWGRFMLWTLWGRLPAKWATNWKYMGHLPAKWPTNSKCTGHLPVKWPTNSKCTGHLPAKWPTNSKYTGHLPAKWPTNSKLSLIHISEPTRPP